MYSWNGGVYSDLIVRVHNHIVIRNGRLRARRMSHILSRPVPPPSDIRFICFLIQLEQIDPFGCEISPELSSLRDVDVTKVRRRRVDAFLDISVGARCALSQDAPCPRSSGTAPIHFANCPFR